MAGLHGYQRTLCLLAVGWWAAGPAHAWALPKGTTARYNVFGGGENSKRLVTDLRITILGVIEHPMTVHDSATAMSRGLQPARPIASSSVAESRTLIQNETFADWQMEVALEGGKTLTIRGVSEHAPLTTAGGCGRFLRYLLRLPTGEQFDYRDEGTGLAVLPAVAFREVFLPTADDEPVLVDGFAGAGRYLGHIIVLDRVARDFTGQVIEGAKVLSLRPDLLVGTSRNFKDDGRGRPSPTSNYNYIPLVEKDYDELIAAGTNYFGVSAEQAPWVRDRPVFYRGPAAFPEDFYRSNYVCQDMFSDEPMCRLSGQGVVPEELDHPQQMASFLMSRVRHIYSEMSPLKALGAYGTDLAMLPYTYLSAPTWETEYQTAFYELAGGAPGIVHEGRYVKEGYGWEPTALFGSGLDMTGGEMLRCYYAFLRGAARAFNGHWGTSIYGQSDPALRVEALTLAYDMGAKHLWFWTSDHDHHVPYTEQLALTRALMEHAAAHPRRPMDKLLRAAQVGIVFPAGYTLSWGHMWGVRSFSFESRNRTGTPYREVVAAATWEGVLCAKRGIPFDFTVAHEGLGKLGYERLLMVGEDAGVTSVPNLVHGDPSRPSIRLELGEPAEAGPTSASGPRPAGEQIDARFVLNRAVNVDGDLGEWQDAAWIEHRGPPSGEGRWDGPRDLSTRLAFAYDGSNLYVAAAVDDDRHAQPYRSWDLWKGDSLQLGFDPLNEGNTLGYSGNQHEIGLALLDEGRPIAWRWHCRRGQTPREMTTVPLAVRPSDPQGKTFYEAAIPFSELTPMSPGITPLVGIGAVFNDADAEPRETFHETSPGAMTQGKHPARFRKLRLLEASAEAKRQSAGPRAWATVVWHETVAPAGGRFSFDLATASWDDRELDVAARLEALEPLYAVPARAAVRFPSRGTPARRRVAVVADADPGRYRLTITVRDGAGLVLCAEEMTVFISPDVARRSVGELRIENDTCPLP